MQICKRYCLIANRTLRLAPVRSPQARPETVHSSKQFVLERYKLGPHAGARVLVEGRAVGSKVGAGKARVILEAKDMGQLQPGEVLVTKITDPDWRAAALLPSLLPHPDRPDALETHSSHV